MTIVIDIKFYHSLSQAGYEATSYKRIKVAFRGSEFFLGIHELAYWVSKDFPALEDGKNTSHLCHLNSCALPEHLTYESASVNNSRKKCALLRQCSGHGTEPLCIFEWFLPFFRYRTWSTLPWCEPIPNRTRISCFISFAFFIRQNGWQILFRLTVTTILSNWTLILLHSHNS